MYRQTLIQGEVYKNTNKTHREALVKQINVQLVEKCIIKVNHLYNFFSSSEEASRKTTGGREKETCRIPRKGKFSHAYIYKHISGLATPSEVNSA